VAARWLILLTNGASNLFHFGMTGALGQASSSTESPATRSRHPPDVLPPSLGTPRIMATEREQRTAACSGGRPCCLAAPAALRRSGRTAVAVLDEPGAVAGMLRILDIAPAAAQPRPTSEDRRWQRVA
jgi:hypothetical protein